MKNSLIQNLICLLALAFMYQLQAAEEETNKNILKAEAKYNSKMASIIEKAQSDADKAKADLLKALDRELTTATKKGNFDEAMRIKAKLEEMKKEDQVGDLFGDVDVAIKEKKKGSASTGSSDVKLEFYGMWMKGGATPEQKEALVKAVIDPKTNTATLNVKKMKEVLGDAAWFTSTFKMKGSMVTVQPGMKTRFMLREGQESSEERFALIMLIDDKKDYKLNYEIALEAVKELLKENKE